MEAERSFRVMGCSAHVRVVAGDPDPLVDFAVARLHSLEARWSRFRPASELNRLNAMGGVPIVVSADTALLVSRTVQAWEATAGGYDPTLLDALEQAGYVESWDPARRYVAGRGPAPGAHPGRGCAGFVVDVGTGLVELPPGLRIDPGGIGKGLAADLVTAALVDRGATGALVNIGGDVRVRGDDVEGDGWCVAIDDPHDPGADLAVVLLRDGAVATSSRLIRRWRTETGEAHHLLDPRSGTPIEGDVDAVTVVAGEGWWAEALTKAAFVAGAAGAEDVIAAAGAAGVVVLAGGSTRSAGDWETYAAPEVHA